MRCEWFLKLIEEGDLKVSNEYELGTLQTLPFKNTTSK